MHICKHIYVYMALYIYINIHIIYVIKNITNITNKTILLKKIMFFCKFISMWIKNIKWDNCNKIYLSD